MHHLKIFPTKLSNPSNHARVLVIPTGTHLQVVIHLKWDCHWSHLTVMVQHLYSSHVILLFNHYNILQLNFQPCKSVCTIMHDVSNNSLPANISNLFLYPTQVHSYNTRFSTTSSFNIKYSRTNQLKHSFSIFGARIWNSIPQSIQILPTHKFKGSLHQLFYIFWNWRIIMWTHLLQLIN